MIPYAAAESPVCTSAVPANASTSPAADIALPLIEDAANPDDGRKPPPLLRLKVSGGEGGAGRGTDGTAETKAAARAGIEGKLLVPGRRAGRSASGDGAISANGGAESPPEAVTGPLTYHGEGRRSDKRSPWGAGRGDKARAGEEDMGEERGVLAPLPRNGRKGRRRGGESAGGSRDALQGAELFRRAVTIGDASSSGGSRRATSGSIAFNSANQYRSVSSNSSRRGTSAGAIADWDPPAASPTPAAASANPSAASATPRSSLPRSATSTITPTSAAAREGLFGFRAGARRLYEARKQAKRQASGGGGAGDLAGRAPSMGRDVWEAAEKNQLVRWVGSAERGSAERGSAEGENAEGGSAEGGSVEGGSAEGGSAEGGRVEGKSAEGRRGGRGVGESGEGGWEGSMRLREGRGGGEGEGESESGREIWHEVRDMMVLRRGGGDEESGPEWDDIDWGEDSEEEDWEEEGEEAEGEEEGEEAEGEEEGEEAEEEAESRGGGAAEPVSEVSQEVEGSVGLRGNEEAFCLNEVESGGDVSEECEEVCEGERGEGERERREEREQREAEGGEEREEREAEGSEEGDGETAEDH
ncbi:unnamed protein product, partial [Closterium sp. NIES-64]